MPYQNSFNHFTMNSRFSLLNCLELSDKGALNLIKQHLNADLYYIKAKQKILVYFNRRREITQAMAVLAEAKCRYSRRSSIIPTKAEYDEFIIHSNYKRKKKLGEVDKEYFTPFKPIEVPENIELIREKINFYHASPYNRATYILESTPSKIQNLPSYEQMELSPTPGKQQMYSVEKKESVLQVQLTKTTQIQAQLQANVKKYEQINAPFSAVSISSSQLMQADEILSVEQEIINKIVKEYKIAPIKSLSPVRQIKLRSRNVSPPVSPSQVRKREENINVETHHVVSESNKKSVKTTSKERKSLNLQVQSKLPKCLEHIIQKQAKQMETKARSGSFMNDHYQLKSNRESLAELIELDQSQKGASISEKVQDPAKYKLNGLSFSNGQQIIFQAQNLPSFCPLNSNSDDPSQSGSPTLLAGKDKHSPARNSPKSKALFQKSSPQQVGLIPFESFSQIAPNNQPNFGQIGRKAHSQRGQKMRINQNSLSQCIPNFRHVPMPAFGQNNLSERKIPEAILRIINDRQLVELLLKGN